MWPEMILVWRALIWYINCGLPCWSTYYWAGDDFVNTDGVSHVYSTWSDVNKHSIYNVTSTVLSTMIRIKCFICPLYLLFYAHTPSYIPNSHTQSRSLCFYTPEESRSYYGMAHVVRLSVRPKSLVRSHIYHGYEELSMDTNYLYEEDKKEEASKRCSLLHGSWDQILQRRPLTYGSLLE